MIASKVQRVTGGETWRALVLRKWPVIGCCEWQVHKRHTGGYR